MAAVSILIVDDHQAFRQIVRTALQSRPDFHVIAEAANGMEAVQSARALQPDVILLDVKSSAVKRNRGQQTNSETICSLTLNRK